MSKEKSFLICYDIANPKRLSRVHRIISKKAKRMQYSVYYLVCTTRKLDLLLNKLEAIIKITEDDIRVYQIPSLDKIEWLGQNWIPDWVLLT